MAEYEIHPAIGVARVGNSEKGYFIAPEPAVPDADYVDGKLLDNPATMPPPATFRDEHGRLLRQAVRFRVFEVIRDGGGFVVGKREVTDKDVTVTWSVHLANRKGAAIHFADRKKAAPEQRRRNGSEAERDVIIDAESQEITEN